MEHFELMKSNFKDQAILLAIMEDSAEGDHSSNACILEGARNRAALKIKEDGILSGVEVAELVIKKLDPDVMFHKIMNDGSCIRRGDIAFTLEGNTRSILRAERIILNLMQRMSGISTNTARYVEKVKNTKAKILDTRKTAPCLRYFDKEAVKHGGGHNHRFGLYDMIMLKDNHIDYAGGIEAAIRKTHEYLKQNDLTLEIEVEVRNFKDIEDILRIGGIHRIMLDNFDVPMTKLAVSLINGAFPIESSGGITLDTIGEYALCGVDFISVGALTHNVKGLDMSLKAI